MGLLDDLKNQTADLKAREQRERELRAQQQLFFQETIKPKIESIYSYLYQFVEQLNYLQPDISVDYTLPGDIELAGLAQGDYSLKVDSRENMTEVVLRFYCQAEGEIFFEVDNKGQFDKLRDIFHQSRLRYRTRTNKDAKQTVLGGDFTIEKVVPIYFRFEADVDNSCILLWIRNFEDLGLRRFVLPPEKVDEAFLDDIGKYALRQVDAFMRLNLEEDRLNQIRDQVEQNKRQREQEIRLAEERDRQQQQAEREKKIGFRVKQQIKGIYSKVKKSPE